MGLWVEKLKSWGLEKERSEAVQGWTKITFPGSVDMK